VGQPNHSKPESSINVLALGLSRSHLMFATPKFAVPYKSSRPTTATEEAGFSCFQTRDPR
jgi:hypothetical protein